jgi:predicted RNA-binding protein associated with RNAse of E/G family
MKYKYANRADWKRVVEREYKQMYVEEDEFTGHITLFILKKVREQLFVTVDKKEPFCVADDGYMWLQYFPLGRNHSMTAMYNSRGEITQWYFDVAREPKLTEEGIPYFADLYLDVVVLPSKEVFLLDEDELQEALDYGVITVDEYDLAKREAEELMKSVRDDKNELIHRCSRDLKLLLKS